MADAARVLNTTPDWIYTTIPWEQCDDERREWIEHAYLEGELSWKLSPNQLDSYDKIRAWEKRDYQEAGIIYAFDSSRRFGKSAIAFVRRLEDCVRTKNARFVYIAPTWEQLRQYVLPIASRLLADCPPRLKIHYRKSDRQYWVPWTNSHIQFVGMDRNPDSARGAAIDGGELDEAGFFDNLQDVLHNVLKPQCMGRPHARIICASTPADTPDHPWSDEVVPQCIARGAHDKKTLDDADHYSPAQREFFWNDMPGGRTGNKARREYGAEHIADVTRAIFPEFLEAEKPIVGAMGIPVPGIVREIEAPEFRDCYTAMDPGWSDMTGILFGYWHFEQQTLVIEDESCRPKKNSRRIARTILKKEERLWANCTTRTSSGGQRPQPYLRVSDNDMRLIADMYEEFGLTFMATDKSDLDQHVVQVRKAIELRRIIIHPRCVKLVKQLRNGVWKKRAGKGHTEFAQGGGEFGHFDLLAALVYLYRNINKRRNPAGEFGRYIAGTLPDKRPKSAAKPVSKWARTEEQRQRFRRAGHTLFLKTGRIGGNKPKENLDIIGDEDDDD